MSKFRYSILLVFIFIWAALAIHPFERLTWFLENIAVVVGVAAATFSLRRIGFSDQVYALFLLFLILHSVGAHYSYERVPFGEALGAFMGIERNPYDRLVHFSFGFLLFPAFKEIAYRFFSGRTFALYAPIFIILSFSALYEIFEWIVAFALRPEESKEFLGSQGDFWDSEKDMAFAALGALSAYALSYFLERAQRAQ